MHLLPEKELPRPLTSLRVCSTTSPSPELFALSPDHGRCGLGGGVAAAAAALPVDVDGADDCRSSSSSQASVDLSVFLAGEARGRGILIDTTCMFCSHIMHTPFCCAPHLCRF